ncbi:L-rhamnose mutarotase [Algoriphagus sp. H41]|uniref:L-rhamnose mutarotase n=1 Tax=Algoriphagus oliviformis TaxID=2811231 RepID=A0ABS3C7R9_9BACT|nr:L-rhamnose mutarotase [Algoriphagus oliviformis]MBN7812606.1 L-rhamnose mutarotase [Algoriphagus oliviformis]
MKTFLLICDLKDEPEAIQAYVDCHKAVDPAILESIRVAGIVQMSIYRWRNRLSMILVANEEFSFEKKAKLDDANPKVQEWEAFLGQYQTNLPGTPPNWRWAMTEKIFEFSAE